MIKTILRDLAYHFTIKPKLKKLRRLLPEAQIFPTGSRYICNPPIMISDVDFVVYTTVDLSTKLSKLGYSLSYKANYLSSVIEDDEPEFFSWRKGVINLIVTSSAQFTDRFNVSTSICRKYNTRRKYHRVVIHESLRSGKNIEAAILENDEISQLLENMTGTYSEALIAVYKIQNNVPSVSVQ